MNEDFPESVINMLFEKSVGVTAPIDDYLKAEAMDDNLWWRLGSGHQQNLFEDAVDRMRTAEARLALADAMLEIVGPNVGMGVVVIDDGCITAPDGHCIAPFCKIHNPKRDDD